MFSKAAISLAVFAVARLALAQPYCLIAALNKFDHPADQQSLCCSQAKEVKDKIYSDICPTSMQADALTAFHTACKEAGHEVGSCEGSSSSAASSVASRTRSSSGSSTSAPYPVVYTSTYYDEECTCTKTKTVSSVGIAGSTGLATGSAALASGTSAASVGAVSGSGSPSAVTGSPISPANPSKTGSGSSSTTSPAGFKGAATKNVRSWGAGLLAVAGVAIAF